MRQQIISYLVNNKGLTPAQAEGVVLNIADESSFNPSAVGDNGQAYGLFQHHGPRRDALFRYAGTNKPSWQQQIDFASTEPDWEAFRNATAEYTEPGKTAVSFMNLFERPAEKHARARAAKYLGSSPQTMETQSMTDPSMTWKRWDGPQGLHPQLEQLLAGQQREASPWDALLGFGVGALSGGGGNWVGRGMAGAAQQMTAGQPEPMTALQVLQANNELYELEEKTRERDRQRTIKKRVIDRLRNEGKHDEADLIEAELLTQSDVGSLLGVGSDGQVSYGTTPHYETDDDGNTYVVRYATDGTKIREPVEGKPFSVESKQPGFQREVARAKKWGDLGPQRAEDIATELAAANASLTQVSYWINELESGKYDKDLGPIYGPIKKFFSPDTARAEAASMEMALENLQITNLAPVTEMELALVTKMGLNPYATPEQNIAVLKRVKELRQFKIQSMRKALRRIREEGYENYILNPEEPEIPPELLTDPENPDTATSDVDYIYDPETGEFKKP